MDHCRESPRLHDHIDPFDPQFVPPFVNLLRVALEHEREVDNVDVIGTAGVRVKRLPQPLFVLVEVFAFGLRDS
jgi:hypothetical protein